MRDENNYSVTDHKKIKHEKIKHTQRTIILSDLNLVRAANYPGRNL